MDEYVISTGRSRTETEWMRKSVTWDALKERLKHCKRTAESVADYKAMSRQQKGKVKDTGGFVGGAIDGGRRKADSMVSRSLLTLDIDYGQADTPEVIADTLYDTAWCLYSTHSHTPETPRFRLVIPLSREVTPEEYIPIARRIADQIDIDIFDSSTYEPCRLMYWPSCPRDGEYVYREGSGAPVNADEILDSYGDWRNIAEWPMDRRTVRIAQGAGGAKQEDPLEKPGAIGAFCRCYSISEAISAFLSDVYAPTAHDDRYTFIGGTTASGLVVYEDKYAYSHHGTDPCCEKLCNAFDLVRIHKFGDEDQDADINTPTPKLPSFLAMERFARQDPKVSGLMATERLKELNEDFAGLGAEDTEWTTLLQMDERRKNFLASPYNFGLIIKNDPALKDTARRDLLRGRDVLARDLPWRRKDLEPFWNNTDDNGLVDYISEHYCLTGKQAILDANDLVISQNSYHPVRDYLRGLVWDGTPRLDTLLCDYLGAEDSELIRAMTRKHFTAAVARVMVPGCKYDYVLTLIGPEGLGKSSLIRYMGKDEWFDDSLTSIEGKDGMEQIRGKWLVEFGELTNYKKSTSEAYKAFISKQEDSYRPAYGRKTEVYPRQCVFFATTNEKAFLKGDTGNRRFWTVECGLDLPTKDIWDDLPGEVDQIWAEAVRRWRDREPLYLSHELQLLAAQLQETHNEVQADDRAGMIEAFIRKELPATWASMTMRQRQDWFKTCAELDASEPRIQRETICAVEILVELFGQQLDEKTRYRTKEINQILREMRCLEYEGLAYDKTYGRQRRFRIITNQP
jgi:predicted P-loop ATPase